MYIYVNSRLKDRVLHVLQTRPLPLTEKKHSFSYQAPLPKSYKTDTNNNTLIDAIILGARFR